jgi:hypothetical protein
MKPTAYWTITLLSVCLIAFATPLRVFVHASEPEYYQSGVPYLLMGWVPFYPYFVPWAANVFLVVALERMWNGNHRLATMIAAVAVALASLPFFLLEPEYNLKLGYYLWLAAMVVAFMGSALLTLRDHCRSPANTEHRILGE